MRLPLTPKPDTLVDRAEGLGRDAVDFARSVPERLDTSRKRALAVAGGAASAAAGFAFWRSRHDDRPSIHADPARSTPWKTPPRSTQPVTDSKAAAEHVAGTRSK